MARTRKRLGTTASNQARKGNMPLLKTGRNDITVQETSKPTTEEVNYCAVKEEIEVECDIVIKQEIEEEDEPVTTSNEIDFVQYAEVVKSEIKTEVDVGHLDTSETYLHSSDKKSCTKSLKYGSKIVDGGDDDCPDDPAFAGESDESDADEEEDESDDSDSDQDWHAPRRGRKVDHSLFCCFHCDFTCKLKSELSDHLETHSGDGTVKCEFCDDVFLKPQSLKIHLHTKHPALVNDKSLKYSCKFCERKYSTKQYLSEHVRSMHTNDTPYECTLCSKKFARRGGLLQHERFHQKARPFTCKLCDATFKSKANRESHMRRHFGVKAFKCDECEKDFIRKDQLKKHVASVHKKESSYKCSICNKYFKGHILSHLRTHASEKLFTCKECDKSFAQSSQLTVHMRTHTGAKPYQCTICNSSFAHSPALKAHLLIHTGEKPVKCPLCPAAFKQLPHMKKHMRCIHKCDKPYVCVPCHKFFKTKAELQSHTITDKNCKSSKS